MTLKRFRKDDMYHNVVVTHPDIEFFVNNNKIYYNRKVSETGNHSNTVTHVPQGYISLYEQNVDRPATGLISRFITKETSRGAFKTVSTSAFQDFGFGDTITDTYPLSASISRILIPSGQEFDTIDFTSDIEQSNVFAHNNKKYIRSLKNYIESGQNRSTEFNYGDKGTSNVNFNLYSFYILWVRHKTQHYQDEVLCNRDTNSYLEETNGTGELMQTYGPGSGSVAGILLKEQGLPY